LHTDTHSGKSLLSPLSPSFLPGPAPLLPVSSSLSAKSQSEAVLNLPKYKRLCPPPLVLPPIVCRDCRTQSTCFDDGQVFCKRWTHTQTCAKPFLQGLSGDCQESAGGRLETSPERAHLTWAAHAPALTPGSTCQLFKMKYSPVHLAWVSASPKPQTQCGMEHTDFCFFHKGLTAVQL
jgi:hypothetical protein